VFAKSTAEIKEKVYNALVRSKVEYAATAWDPHTKHLVNSLEMVQRRATRFVMNDYNLESSVSEMVEKLNWDALQMRRTFARLKNFYLVYNGVGGWVDLVEYLKPAGRMGRSEREFAVRTNVARTNIGKFSFITRTSVEWNNLPAEILTNSSTLRGFKGQLRSHLFGGSND